ncbi:hypothetical protein [Tateyamaria sp. ANG-S1]|uniref:hypothetical protein n=1 Tax=Tateyamaria sp. ANG-S1 TaxID=1577905 RepID=UPI00126A4B92|nr:hypothetical protein [Tateyamaria sp. ANG-S1]
MEIWAGALSVILAGLGVFFGQAGERNRVTRVGYAILVLILISGTVDTVATTLNKRSAEKEAEGMRTAIELANRQIVIQNIDLDRPFYDVSVWAGFEIWGRENSPSVVDVSDLSFEPAYVAPFWPKQSDGDEVAKIEIRIGESTNRGFTLVQTEEGILVTQSIGLGEGAERFSYIYGMDSCTAVEEGQECSFTYSGGRAAYQEGIDLGSAGASFDVSSQISAGRTISDLLTQGVVMNIRIPDAYKHLAWWQLGKRNRLTRLWVEELDVGISLRQARNISQEKTTPNESCLVTFSIDLHPSDPWTQHTGKRLNMFQRWKTRHGFGLFEDDLWLSYFPEGVISQQICPGYP